MTGNSNEIARRKALAITAIKAAYEMDDDDHGVSLFIAHHLLELDESYWLHYLNTGSPEPNRVLDLLVLRSHWSEDDEDGLDFFDFTLPEDATDYIICVQFTDTGDVDCITMES